MKVLLAAKCFGQNTSSAYLCLLFKLKAKRKLEIENGFWMVKVLEEKAFDSKGFGRWTTVLICSFKISYASSS